MDDADEDDREEVSDLEEVTDDVLDSVRLLVWLSGLLSLSSGLLLSGWLSILLLEAWLLSDGLEEDAEEADEDTGSKDSYTSESAPMPGSSPSA